MQRNEKMKSILTCLCYLILTSCGSSTPVDDNANRIHYGTLFDARDGESYRTIVIGTQTWMAQNLNFDTLQLPYSACYLDSTKYCTNYGRLYSWSAAMNINTEYDTALWGGSDQIHEGICPSGWHIPNLQEWQILIKFAGSTDSAGKRLNLKSSYGTDEFGFSTLLVGVFYANNIPGAQFQGFGNKAAFWTSSEANAKYGNDEELLFGNTYVYQYGIGKQVGHSIRCILN
jgi:uncharacterized protein (TIGR02145 family)